MTIFSFSAPTVSAATERKEWEELSEAEREAVHRDLYGTLPQSDRLCENSDPNVLKQAGLDFSDEIKQIPLDDKKAYMEAVRRCPDLVQSESSLLKFFRCEDYNGRKAARRIVRYWQMRLHIFGNPRAYLPLTLAGALKEDEKFISTGIFQIVPKDIHGRAVLVYERHAVKEITKAHIRARILRLFWYFLQILSETETEFVIVANCKQYSVQHFDRKMTVVKWKTLRECSPIRLRAVHTCATVHRMTYKLVWPVVRHLIGPFYRPRVKLHVGSDPHLQEAVKAYGIRIKSMPESLGGAYTKENFDEWLKHRRAREEPDPTVSRKRKSPGPPPLPPPPRTLARTASA